LYQMNLKCLQELQQQQQNNNYITICYYSGKSHKENNINNKYVQNFDSNQQIQDVFSEQLSLCSVTSAQMVEIDKNIPYIENLFDCFNDSVDDNGKQIKLRKICTDAHDEKLKTSLNEINHGDNNRNMTEQTTAVNCFDDDENVSLNSINHGDINKNIIKQTTAENGTQISNNYNNLMYKTFFSNKPVGNGLKPTKPSPIPNWVEERRLRFRRTDFHNKLQVTKNSMNKTIERIPYTCNVYNKCSQNKSPKTKCFKHSNNNRTVYTTTSSELCTMLSRHYSSPSYQNNH